MVALPQDLRWRCSRFPRGIRHYGGRDRDFLRRGCGYYTAIFAAGDGVIEKLYVSSSFGKYIKIAHKNGFSTAYAHMDTFGEGLATGSRVTKGQVIGTVGNTGRSSAPHLHFELHYGNRTIDPLFKYDPNTDS